MSEMGNTIAAPETAYRRTTHPGMTADAAGAGMRLMRRLMMVNLGLVALQPVSAGFFLSGYEYALAAHTIVAQVLQLGALVQAVTAVVLWRRGRVPGWVAGVSAGMFVVLALQVGLGYSKQFWLHVPLGVALVGWLARRVRGQ